MTFREKSTWAMTGILLAVFGWYFTLVFGAVAASPVRDIAYKGLMVPVVVAVVVLATGVHAAIAAASPGEAGTVDERDRLAARRGGQVARYVLAVGVFAGLGLTMVDADRFWIAQALIATLVLGELAEGATVLAGYRGRI